MSSICNTTFLKCRLPVHVFYDDTFNARFGAAAGTRITALFTVVKAIYAQASLTTRIVPMIVETTYKAGETWRANGDTLRYVY